jgi:hypothetical protein
MQGTISFCSIAELRANVKKYVSHNRTQLLSKPSKQKLTQNFKTEALSCFSSFYQYFCSTPYGISFLNSHLKEISLKYVYEHTV